MKDHRTTHQQFRPVRLAVVTALLLVATAFATLQAMGQPLVVAESESGVDTLRITDSFDTELAITDKRIEYDRLRADAGVAVGTPSDPIEVSVGASIQAEHVVIALRNVFGHVRMHASLERIVDAIESHRPPAR